MRAIAQTIVAVCSALALAASSAHASGDVERLLAEGVVELHAERHERALEIFTQADAVPCQGRHPFRIGRQPVAGRLEHEAIGLSKGVTIAPETTTAFHVDGTAEPTLQMDIFAQDMGLELEDVVLDDRELDRKSVV